MMLETPSLLIREYTLDDIDQLLPILSDPTTMRFWPQPFSLDQVAGWIDRSLASYAANGFGRYAVIERAEGRMIGDCGLILGSVDGETVYDLGYIIHHPWWRRGYATEAAAAIRDHAFRSLGIDRLHANMAVDHEGSRRVAEKIGMTLVREFINQRNRNLPTLLFILENVR